MAGVKLPTLKVNSSLIPNADPNAPFSYLIVRLFSCLQGGSPPHAPGYPGSPGSYGGAAPGEFINSFQHDSKIVKFHPILATGGFPSPNGASRLPPLIGAPGLESSPEVREQQVWVSGLVNLA